MQYHFIGIGGIGMSGIAQLLLKRGERVSGSDSRESEITRELKNAGARIYIGHKESNITGADLIVRSTAISADNPEICAAIKQNIPVIKRAQALAELMRGEKVITVTGSHGKTTTTAMAGYLLLRAGYSPTVAVGGILRNINNNALSGEGGYFVAEADESDGSFLYYQPRYSIITNIDHEHLDYYGSFECALKAYADFLKQTTSDGCVFCCNDDAHLKKILQTYSGKRVLFGLDPGADIYPKQIKINGLSSEFDCFCKDKFVQRFNLQLAGAHNISNALGVVALGLELGIDLKTIKAALSDYQGARRRIEVKFDNKDYMIIDDYAHHPTEIKATLDAVGALGKRIVAVFQPHRYTRTQLLLSEFAGALKKADYIIITDIYSAGESSMDGVSGRLLCETIRSVLDKQIHFLPKEEIVPHILNILRPNDLAITLGAGDIYRIGDELARRLSKNDSQIA